jgi:DNA-binding NtrC family response regulator
MKENILIVEDEFIVANDLRIMLEKANYKVCGIAPSVAKAIELIDSKNPSWILLDIFLQGDKTGIDLGRQLSAQKVPFIYISANTNQAILEAAKSTLPYGFLVKPFREKDLLVMLDIALYRHEQNQIYSKKQPSLKQEIEEITNRNESLNERLKYLTTALYAVIPFDHLWLSRADSRAGNKDFYVSRSEEGNFKTFGTESLLSEISVGLRDFKTWNVMGIPNPGDGIFNSYGFRKLRMEHTWIRVLSDHFKFESALVIEIERAGDRFQFIFFSRIPELYTKNHHNLMSQYKECLELILESVAFGREPLPGKGMADLTANQVVSLEEKSSSVAPDFNGIIGNSSLLLDVFRKIELVAPDETSVLILGESGTGKEKIAHTIHKRSPRKSKPLIIVNCAALPLNLIESELFGHEKGSFTGASEKRIGKFEQADGGSIFLDEIGELPLEAQVKLLRVLQEKEIERLGGNQTRKVNLRIITATNRNLEKEVAEGRFRLDLYYRLNVFPIELPALRDRKEDIPVLASHFLNKLNKRSSSNVRYISDEVLETLQTYDWPGNIRELEHLIERSMLLSIGDTITEIQLPLSPKRPTIPTADNIRVRTLEEMEREHILGILKMCKGKIYGPGGAAELLNIPSTTLNSKIKKLGIKYEFVK